MRLGYRRVVCHDVMSLVIYIISTVVRSGLPTGGLPRCREVRCPTDYDGYMVRYIWFLSKV